MPDSIPPDTALSERCSCWGSDWDRKCPLHGITRVQSADTSSEALSELVERAANALVDWDNPYLGHQFPDDHILAVWAAETALEAAGVPLMVEVIEAARDVMEPPARSDWVGPLNAALLNLDRALERYDAAQS